MVFLKFTFFEQSKRKSCPPQHIFNEIIARLTKNTLRIFHCWVNIFILLTIWLLSLLSKSSVRKSCWHKSILDSIEVSIPACHAGDPGSIPGRGGLNFYYIAISLNWRSTRCCSGNHFFHSSQKKSNFLLELPFHKFFIFPLKSIILFS